MAWGPVFRVPVRAAIGGPEHRRRTTPLRIVAKPEVEETSKLSRWPPAMFKQWKLENLTRWTSATWKLKDWL